MKDNIDLLIPQYVVDITGLPLSYVNFSQSDGIRIGATTNVSTSRS